MSIVTKKIEQLFVCPSCKCTINKENNYYKCSNLQCQQKYPIVNSVPIFINNKKSVFSIEDFLDGNETTIPQSNSSVKKIGKIIQEKFVPKISKNLNAKKNYSLFIDNLVYRCSNPTILVVGCGDMGQGFKKLLECKNITLIQTDVYFSSLVNFISDAHDIPIANNSIDGIVIQAVLEHVINPQLCVSEAFRVLKESGLIYVETPFMQPVHMKEYDFQRFSMGGLRILLKSFEEIKTGIVCGPSMSLANSISSFIGSISNSVFMKCFRQLILPFFIFWLKYIDYLLIDKPQSEDAASGLFFLGKKSDITIEYKAILKKYWQN